MSFQRPWHKWYGENIPSQLEYSTIPLKDQFNRWVDVQPDKALIYYLDKIYTYAEVNSQAQKLANALIYLGVKKGDRVSITLPNIPEFVIATHACLKMGAIIVPANSLYTPRELADQYQDSGVKTIITMASVAKELHGLLADQKSPVSEMIAVNWLTTDGVAGLPGVYDYQELIDHYNDQEPVLQCEVEDVILLQYTGGTTGVPKGCCITNANLIACATAYFYWCGSLTSPEEHKTLCTVPLYHIYGFNTQICFTIYTGGSIILLPEITPNSILKAFDDYEPTHWSAVPALIQALNMHPGLPASKVKSVKAIICGSAPLPVEALKTFEKISGAKIIEGFGGSETTNMITGNPVHKQKAGSVGIPFPDNDVKVVDLETGEKEMPIGEPGELIFKGSLVIREYWNKPEETKIAIRDGWLYTGDIGYLDKDHYIYIVDRKKDMIICSGFNVYPRDIDEVLYANSKVLEAGAIGLPDPKRGETVKVFVVVKPGESMTEDEVIDWCRKSLAPYKVPKMVEFVEALPRTNMKKVDRKALRAMELAKRDGNQ